MSAKQEKIDYGKEIMRWRVFEYIKHERGKRWYVIASIVTLLLLVYAFFSSNFLFAVIIIIVAIVMVLNDGQNPGLVEIVLTDEGVFVGKKFYDYDEFKNFSVIYKPRQGVKNLYFEFKNSIKPRLSIPLEKNNPLTVRENLLKYVEEDLERTDQPLSEGLAKIFRI